MLMLSIGLIKSKKIEKLVLVLQDFEDMGNIINARMVDITK